MHAYEAQIFMWYARVNGLKLHHGVFLISGSVQYKFKMRADLYFKVVVVVVLQSRR